MEYESVPMAVPIMVMSDAQQASLPYKTNSSRACAQKHHQEPFWHDFTGTLPFLSRWEQKKCLSALDRSVLARDRTGKENNYPIHDASFMWFVGGKVHVHPRCYNLSDHPVIMQVVFMNNPLTGAMIVAAIACGGAVNGWWHAALGVLGAVCSTLAIFIVDGSNKTALNIGLYGFNGFLVGEAMGNFVSAGNNFDGAFGTTRTSFIHT